MANQSPDWELIESQYRAGSLSIRAIADQHGVTEGAIRKRAKKYAWKRDLTHRVRSETKLKLVRKTVRGSGTQKDVRTDDQIVGDASDTNVNLLFSHQKVMAEWGAIAGKLISALSKMDVTDANHQEFSRSLNAGVDAQGKIIKLQRQAYNIDDQPQRGDVDTLSDLMDTLSDEA